MNTGRVPYDPSAMDEATDFAVGFMRECQGARASGTLPDFRDWSGSKLQLALEVWRFVNRCATPAEQQMINLRAAGYDVANVVALPRRG